MQRTLAIVGALALLIIVAGASYRTLVPALPTPQQVPGGVRIADLPMSRHIHFVLNLQGGQPPLSLPTNPGIGVAVAEIKPTSPTQPPVGFNILVDGVLVTRAHLGAAYASGAEGRPFPFNPPLIVRPGSVLEFANATTGLAINISGYLIFPSDL